MPKFIIDRIKDNKKEDVAEAEFKDGNANVTGEDADAVAEITELVKKEHETFRAADTGDIAVTATEIVTLKPGTEEHFITLMGDLPKYGYMAREVA